MTASLLHAQGLHPRVQIVAAVRTWMSGQLADAERLVAVLAGAYVTQDGFNRRDAGGNPDQVAPEDWPEHEEYVFARVNYFADNMAHTMRDLDKAARIRELSKAMDIVADGTMESRQRQCEAGARRLRDQIEEGQDDVDAVETLHVDQAKCAAALQQRGDMLLQATEVVSVLGELVRVRGSVGE